MDPVPYDQTTGELARRAATTVQSIIKYCDLGLLDYIRLSNGLRLLRRGQEPRVGEIRTERLSRRGRKAKVPAAA